MNNYICTLTQLIDLFCISCKVNEPWSTAKLSSCHLSFDELHLPLNFDGIFLTRVCCNSIPLTAADVAVGIVQIRKQYPFSKELLVLPFLEQSCCYYVLEVAANC